jgi:hypothetical protein
MSKKIDVKPFVRAIKDITKVSPSLLAGALVGTVTSANPVKIKVDNGVELSGSMIWLSPFCQEWKTERIKHKHTYNVSHSHSYTDDSGDSTSTKTTEIAMADDRDTSEEIETFTYWKGLEVNDKVILVRINDSQIYLALWKENQFRLEV